MNNEWKRNSERADYAVDFRREAKKIENRPGQNVISHVSHAEIQANDSTKQSIEWREEHFDAEHFDA